MSTIILQKDADCVDTVQVVQAITTPTQFTLSTKSAVNATIYFNGALIATLNSTNPTYDVYVAGDYTVQLTGKCSSANVCIDEILEGSASSEQVDSDILTNCENRFQTESVDQRVSIVGSETPLNVRLVEDCNPLNDYEIVCASTDNRLLLLNTTASPPTLTELDGTVIGDGATAVNCDVEFKFSETCYQDDTDASIRYTRLICFPVGDPSQTTIVWLDAFGDVITEPTNIELCPGEITGNSCDNPTFTESCKKEWVEVLCDVIPTQTVFDFAGIRAQAGNMYLSSALGNTVAGNSVAFNSGFDDLVDASAAVQADWLLFWQTLFPGTGVSISVDQATITIDQDVSNVTPDWAGAVAQTYPSAGSVIQNGVLPTGPIVELISDDPTEPTGTVSLVGDTKFQRCFTSDSLGVVTSVDLDFDGNPYVVQGDVGACTEDPTTGNECTNPTFVENCKKEWVETLCDDTLNDGTIIVNFQRCFTRISTGVVSFIDLDFDGNGYTTLGTVDKCTQEVTGDSCVNPTFVESCVKEWVETLYDVIDEDPIQGYIAGNDVFDIGGSNLGTLSPTVSPLSTSSIEYDPVANLIYAIRSVGSVPSIDIYDPVTYVRISTTLITGMGGIPGSPPQFTHAAAIDPTTGLLWVKTTDGSGPEEYYILDPVTAVATHQWSTLEVGNNSVAGALAFTPDGRQFSNGIPGTDDIFERDKATGLVINTIASAGFWTTRRSMDFANNGLLYVLNNSVGIEVYDISGGTLVLVNIIGTIASTNFALIQGAGIASNNIFQRCFTRDSTGVVSFIDLDLDGNPYVVSGNLQKCNSVTLPEDIEVSLESANESSSTVIFINTSAASSTSANLQKVSISNVGSSAGTVQGNSLPVGASLEFEAYHNPTDNTWRRIPAIAYDATGTTFLIAETV